MPDNAGSGNRRSIFCDHQKGSNLQACPLAGLHCVLPFRSAMSGAHSWVTMTQPGREQVWLQIQNSDYFEHVKTSDIAKTCLIPVKDKTLSNTRAGKVHRPQMSIAFAIAVPALRRPSLKSSHC